MMRKAMWALILGGIPLWVWCSGCGGGGGTGGATGPAIVDLGTEPGAGEVIRTLDGRLVSATGAPIANATVGLPSRTRQGGVLTDANGRFLVAIRVLPTLATITLEIRLPYGTTTQSVIDLPTGQSTVRPVVLAANGAKPDPANAAPTIAAGHVTPQVVDVSGAVVGLSATVADAEHNPLTVVALVVDGDRVTPALLHPSAGAAYQQTLAIEANLGASENDRTVKVWFCATDAPEGSCRSVTFGPVDLLVKGMLTPPNLPSGLD
ncbi:MAG: carboxypeptidase regulatory-like domain-containing protein [Armatimonadetes bacterium]|nr:carboxypeptidase regulatory-like domain-containing protein [Armatimonadota bacterium]NCO94089.1 carboxypeptidase regulatory-like domain-containing protein [Armatimonadota bacterium]NCP31391.1 carboxypeptidase regulatory-like domain-containing protein [Armatimonadota bacterium]NDK14379.1 carboxypeptidase regulatory-like domain-containing protein [Armatimonadota bacterium]